MGGFRFSQATPCRLQARRVQLHSNAAAATAIAAAGSKCAGAQRGSTALRQHPGAQEEPNYSATAHSPSTASSMIPRSHKELSGPASCSSRSAQRAWRACGTVNRRDHTPVAGARPTQVCEPRSRPCTQWAGNRLGRVSTAGRSCASVPEMPNASATQNQQKKHTPSLSSSFHIVEAALCSSSCPGQRHMSSCTMLRMPAHGQRGGARVSCTP